MNEIGIRSKSLIAFISAVGSEKEVPIQLWISTAKELDFNILTIMTGKDTTGETGEVESQIISIKLSTPKYFWPNAGYINTIQAVFHRIINTLMISKSLFKYKPNICICSEPDSWVLAIILKIILRFNVIAYVREVFEDRLFAFPNTLRPLLKVGLRQLLRILSARTDEIIHVSEERQQYYGFLLKPGVVVGHFPKEEYFSSLPKDLVYTKGNLEREEILAIHAGALRPTYGSDMLVKAIALANQSCPNIKLLILGGVQGKLQSEELIKELLKINVIEILPQIAHKDVIDLMKISAMGVLYISPDNLTTKLAQPLKLYEYLAAGLPVIASDVPTVRKVINKWNCGILVDPYSVDDIANGIVKMAQNRKLREELGLNAFRAFTEEFNWNIESIKVKNILQSNVKI